MPPITYERSVRLPAGAEEVYAWHGRPGALERLSPPWSPVEVVERTGSIGEGDRAVLRIKAGPFRCRWEAVHHDLPGQLGFMDHQVSGPFSRWVHSHVFESDGPGQCILTDRIEFQLPADPVGNALGSRFVLGELDRVFSYRHAILRQDLETHREGPAQPLRIAITGASGLAGSALSSFLTTCGHQVLPLVRRKAGPGEISWKPSEGYIDEAALEGIDAVIHLAGENIGQRWTPSVRRRIVDSRLQGTRLLAEALARLRRPPRVLLAASAMGYYGDRGDEILDESAPMGTGFLPEICAQWEACAEPASRAGIRVVHLRFGNILSPAGGALAKMLPAFRAGVAGPLGGGGQWMSWISIEDVIAGVNFLLAHPTLSGAVNLSAPAPVTNRDFTRVLARTLHRPAFIPVPAAALRLLFGREMADGTVLASTRVAPARLLAAGYRFRHPELEGALAFLLGRTR